MNEYKIGNLDLIVSDEKIEYGNFFIVLKENGNIEPYIYQLSSMPNFKLNNVKIVTINKLELNKNYKKIINL